MATAVDPIPPGCAYDTLPRPREQRMSMGSAGRVRPWMPEPNTRPAMWQVAPARGRSVLGVLRIRGCKFRNLCRMR